MHIAKYYIHKALYISIFIILTLSLNFNTAFAQLFDSSQNPPRLKWKQISTANFNIIYPTPLEADAQRMANVVNAIIDRVSSSYHKHPRKISIILQNQGTTANGFVQLAPRRSEFFTTPGQEFDYQDWLNSLAVHELRHVVQFDKLTGKLKAPFFEELALAIFGVTLPPWFYEGDAVVTETALTKAGRGRQPEFDLILRTNTLSGKKFSYSKDFIGSVKDFPPGYYQLGYNMVAKLRRDHGANIMDSLLTRIARNPFRPYNLSSSMKKFTGLGTHQLHDATIAELGKKWEAQLKDAAPVDYKIIDKRKDDTPINYFMPAAVTPNEFIALKQGKDIAPVLIKIDSLGTETKIIKIGQQEDYYFRYAAGKLVWDEARPDLRYQKRSFNVINIYDLSTKSLRQLSHRSRLFAPALSSDGKSVMAVEVSYSNKISLVVLNSENGQEIKRYNSPSNYMLQTPSYSADGKKAIIVAVSAEGKTLIELNMETGAFSQLIPFQKQLISKPVYVGNRIVFKAHYNGIDNLYSLNLANKQIVQLTSVKFGAYNPSVSPDGMNVIFNSYQSSGHDIAMLNLNVKPITTKSTAIDYIAPVAAQEGNRNVFDSIPNNVYATKRFHELSHLFNFHSLLPISEDNDYFDDYNVGLKLQSDNKLNTLSSYIGYRFNNALRKSEYVAGFTYSKFYPVLSVEYLNQARFIYVRKFPVGNNTLIPVSWRENQVDLNMNIPFSFSRLNYGYLTGVQTGTSYTSRYDILNKPDNLLTELKFPVNYRFYFSRNANRSARDLAPAWGQNLSVTYRHFPFEHQLSGNLFALRSTFYFPGLFINHSLQASFNYQKSAGNYSSTIDIPRVSGYSNLPARAGLKNTLLTNYRFPIFYPDWEIGPLAYIKRFTGGFFADFENVGGGNVFKPRTYGAELKADMNLLRFYLPNFIPGVKLILVNEKPRQNPIFEASLTYNF